ncbi:MAG: SDR family oxidoreductase [Candidatus Microthrix sp.]|nr:SDR family oxidoreductase [Candidatus Microthrix sp.]
MTNAPNPHPTPVGDAADPLDFSGSVVLVTGGSRGIGRGISEAFLGHGADVVICGRNEPDELPSSGGREARFVAADVRDATAVDALISDIEATEGRLDVVVNNAGGAPHVDAAEVSPRFHEAIIALNLTAPLHVAQRANRVMRTQDTGGSIINIASVSGVRPSPGTAAYGAAKAGLIGLTQSLAVEWAPKVRLNAVVAGLIETEQAHLHYGDEEGVAAVAATVPLGRMGTPTDLANACVFLASPLASYVTGSTLTVHGGGERPAFLEEAQVDHEDCS